MLVLAFYGAQFRHGIRLGEIVDFLVMVATQEDQVDIAVEVVDREFRIQHAVHLVSGRRCGTPHQ
jgi:hypothetical protein